MALVTKNGSISVASVGSNYEPTFVLGTTTISNTLPIDTTVSDLFSVWYIKSGQTNSNLSINIQHDNDKDGDGKHDWICVKILDGVKDVFKRDLKEAYELESAMHYWFVIKNLRSVDDATIGD